MTRITNVDQVLLLLRQQLQRLSRNTASVRKARATGARGPQRQSALDRLAALSRLEDVADDDLERSLVRALLADEFGDRLANDPRFVRVTGEVSRIIAMDEEARDLLKQAVRRVKESR